MNASPVNFLAIAVLAIAVGSVERATAQTPNGFPPPPLPSANVRAMQEQKQFIDQAMQDAELATEGAKVATESVKLRMGNFFGDKRNHELDAQIRQAAAQVRDAKDDAARAAATADLTKLMDQYFEADIRVREQELADIQARLEKLRAQLDRRRQKKSEIIDLQVKVATNEADGLGFYSQPKEDGTFNFRVSTPTWVSPSGDVLTPAINSFPPAPTWVSPSGDVLTLAINSFPPAPPSKIPR